MQKRTVENEENLDVENFVDATREERERAKKSRKFKRRVKYTLLLRWQLNFKRIRYGFRYQYFFCRFNSRNSRIQFCLSKTIFVPSINIFLSCTACMMRRRKRIYHLAFVCFSKLIEIQFSVVVMVMVLAAGLAVNGENEERRRRNDGCAHLYI